jgi:hypothetical protein
VCVVLHDLVFRDNLLDLLLGSRLHTLVHLSLVQAKLENPHVVGSGRQREQRFTIDHLCLGAAEGNDLHQSLKTGDTDWVGRFDWLGDVVGPMGLFMERLHTKELDKCIQIVQLKRNKSQ